MSQISQSNAAVAGLSAAPLHSTDIFPDLEIRSSAPVLARPAEVGERTLNGTGFKFELERTANCIANLAVKAAEKVTELFSSFGLAALGVIRNPRLGVAAAGVMFTGAEFNANGVIIPDGWDDAHYIAFGKLYQTNALSLQIIGTDPSRVLPTFAKNVSATFLNEHFALTAAHNFEGIAAGYQLNVTVATGSNIQTNRGVVVPIDKILKHPLRVNGAYIRPKTFFPRRLRRGGCGTVSKRTCRLRRCISFSVFWT